jgi:hypothetical protein
LRVRVAAGHIDRFLDQLFADTDGLEIHPEQGGRGRPACAIMRVVIDLVEDRLNLETVVALNILEAVRPGIR